MFGKTNLQSKCDDVISSYTALLPKCTSKAKYLGIEIDNSLKLKHFFNKIIIRISIGTFTLNKLKHIFPKKLKLLLYNAFIHSHIEFCSLYLQLATKKQKSIIRKLQKNAIRAIVSERSRSHTAELFQRLRILPMDLIAEINIFKFMNILEISNNIADFNIKLKQNVYNLRTKHIFKEHTAKLNQTKKLPLFTFPKIYNKLKPIYESCNDKYKFDNFREKLVAQYVIENKCNTLNCFICKNHQERLIIEKQRLAKRKEKLHELIKLKGIKKNARYGKLVNRVENGNFKIASKRLLKLNSKAKN